MTEADTCREFVTPKLVEAGWGAAESVIGEQHSFTNGRIIVAGGKVRRGKQRRADYLLYYRRDFPLAVVEAKELGLPAETGVQQARDYAEMLGLKFAYRPRWNVCSPYLRPRRADPPAPTHSMATRKTAPAWTDVKARLADVDRAGLLGLVQDLYGASKDNQAYVHARLHLGEDVLKPYKEAIDRWLWPDVFKNQDTSVAKAKKAITDYKKASGTADGLAELMVFYCERASGFSCDVGLDDEAYLSALVRMFEQALKAVATLPKTQRPALCTRLQMVRVRSHDIGYGVGEYMDALHTEHGTDD